MEHNLIEIDSQSLVNLVIYHKDFNLEKNDNLDVLPKEAAVYAICGRVNNQAANCRFVGVTDDLRKSIKGHFEDGESYECLRHFMQSIKIKEIVYEIISDSSEEDRLKKKEDWVNKYKPNCNEKLNEVY